MAKKIRQGKKIISHTSIYMTGDILRRSVSLIMLPIYTRYLTPEDYGIVELLSMLIDFASIVFGARVGQAVFRFYCTADTAERKKSVISSAIFLSAITNAIGVIAVIALSEHISVLLFDQAGLAYLIQLFAVTMLIEPFMQIPLTYLRAEQRPWAFLFFSLTKLAIQLSLNIYLIVVLEMHVEGVIYSAVASAAIMSIVLTAYTLHKVGINITQDAIKTLFNFSLPLKIATFGSFYMAFGDRYFLKVYTDLAQVGIYSLGYKFGFIFLVFGWDPFQQLWDSEKYNVYKKNNANEIYQKVFLYISIFLILVGLSISLLTKDLLTIMSDPAFLSAHEIVPIIILAYIFQAWAKYSSFGILIHNKTIHLVYAEIAGVIAITIAYVTLIPLYGIYGAAWSTVIGFVVRFLWTDYKARQFYNMHLPWGTVLLTLMLASSVYLVSFLLPDTLLASITSRAALIVVFFIALLMLPILKKRHKKEIYTALASVIRRIKPGT